MLLPSGRLLNGNPGVADCEMICCAVVVTLFWRGCRRVRLRSIEQAAIEQDRVLEPELDAELVVVLAASLRLAGL